MAELRALVRYLDTELRTADVPDYDTAFNGLQLTNGGSVTRVAAAVDFSAETVAGAIRERADLLIVHHGMFWREDQRLVGPAFERLRAAIEAGLAVYASHIPLDLHPVLGNNALLAKALQLDCSGTFGRYRGVEVGVSGSANIPTEALVNRVRSFSAPYNTTIVSTPFAAGRQTRRWAIVTGAGASGETLAEARERDIDTLIVGEGPHHTAVEAMEQGLVIVYGGHYATETLGVQALGESVSKHFDVPWVFVNVPTGL